MRYEGSVPENSPHPSAETTVGSDKTESKRGKTLRPPALHVGHPIRLGRAVWSYQQLTQAIRDFEEHTGRSLKGRLLGFLLSNRWVLALPLGGICFVMTKYIPFQVLGIALGIGIWFTSLRLLRMPFVLSTLLAGLSALVIFKGNDSPQLTRFLFPVITAGFFVIYLPLYLGRHMLRHFEEETGTRVADPDAGLTRDQVGIVEMEMVPLTIYARHQVERVEFEGTSALLGALWFNIAATEPGGFISILNRHWQFHRRHAQYQRIRTGPKLVFSSGFVRFLQDVGLLVLCVTLVLLLLVLGI